MRRNNTSFIEAVEIVTSAVIISGIIVGIQQFF